MNNPYRDFDHFVEMQMKKDRAKVDRVLDSFFGSVVFGDELREAGKTTGIINRMIDDATTIVITKKHLKELYYDKFEKIIGERPCYEQGNYDKNIKSRVLSIEDFDKRWREFIGCTIFFDEIYYLNASRIIDVLGERSQFRGFVSRYE